MAPRRDRDRAGTAAAYGGRRGRGPRATAAPRWLAAGLAMGLVCVVGAASETAPEPRPVSYVRDVRPILQARCQGCHQPAKAEGGYVMTDVPRMLMAGDSGSAGIVPGKPDESHLLDQIAIGPDGAAEMPKDGKPLAEAEFALLRRWIAEGARDDTPASAGQVVDANHPPVYTRQPVVTSIDFSPDGRLLAVAGFHETLVFDLTDVSASGVPTLRTRLVGLSERIERVRFSPDGTRLAATGGNPARMGEVQIWNVADGTLLRSVPVTFDTVYGGAWSPDGRLVAFGCADNTLRAIDAESGAQVLHQGAHEDWVLDTVFSPRGDHLVSVGRDMTAKLTEVATQRFIDNITSITPGALRGGLASVDRHPKLEHIVAAGADGTPRVYRIHRHSKRVIGDDANQIFPLYPVSGRVFGVRFSPDGRRVAAVGGLDGRGELVICSYGLEADVPKEILGIMARVPGSGGQRKGNERKPEQVEQLEKFRAASTALLARVELPSATTYAVAFRPNTAEVAVAGGDGVVRFFDSETGAAGRSFAVAPTKGADAARTTPPLPWPPEPSGEPEKPLAADVQSLLVEPREIALAGPFAAVQIVVTGRLRDGSTADLTRLATIGPEPGAPDATSLVSIGSGGLLRPRSDGAGRLRVSLGATAVAVPVRVEGLASSPDVDFIRDVNPVLTRMGCNQGTCHGAAKGKNGFKLSLRGYDPVFDLRALTEDHGSRRTSLASPDDSLMLLKASAAVPHVGGLLAKPADPNYHVIRRWIEQGATLDQATPRVARLVVTPATAVADLPGRRQQFRVVAEYADGSSRDVTRQAFLESGNTEVATADPTGLVTAVRRGEAPILVRYDGAYAAVTFTVMGDREGFRWRQPEAWGTVDDLVAAKWRALKIEPAPLCSDDEFLRRATLDLTGLPPASDDVRAFLGDGRDPRTKRSELVRRLIGSEAFVEHWTNKWSDLLQVNPKFLGAEGAAALRGWIRSQVAANTPYDRFAREILTAAGSTREHPAASYFKVLRDPLATMENTTHLFLGVRFNCNKCHDHPFERWTQDQYYEMAAFFAQVSLARDPASGNRTIGGTAVEDAKPLHEIVSDSPEGDVKHERTGRPVPPRFPFESPHEPPASPATRRQQFAAWLTAAGNPYFARSHVNRMWGYLFGTGIIDPIDDIRAGNPPTNPPLLEHLTSRFVAGGFDTRRVLEEICTSRTYGLSIAGNRWNEDDRANYSHALPRRLPAETLFDALHAVVGTPTRFPGYPAGTRAASLPDVASKLGGGFLQTFGRPVRESACECERSGGVALGPVMALVSGPAVGDVLADRTSELARLVTTEPDDARLVDEVFLRVLNRPSRPAEVAAATRTMAEIGDDHATLTAELDRAESAWRSRRDALERERTARLTEARRALAAATLAATPRLAEASRARAEAVSSAVTALEARLGDPGAVAREFAAQAASTPRWSVISVDPPSEKDAYVILQDGSLFISGTAAIGTLVLQATVPAGRLTGLRVETIPDPRMPGGGAGRGKDGAFMLTEAFLRVAPVSSPVNSTRLSFARALADHSQPGSDVTLAIDDDLSNTERGWAVGPLHTDPHWAVFEVRDAVTYDEPVRMTIQLDQRRNGGLAGLGRFRLSVTDSPAPLELGVPARGLELLARPAESRTADETRDLQALAAALDASRSKARAKLGESLAPIPPDPEVAARAADVAAAEEPVTDDPAIVRLRSDVAASAAQVGDRRLTAIQDLAWALINSPAFFFNR